MRRDRAARSRRYELTLIDADGQGTRLDDVLAGEIWLCIVWFSTSFERSGASAQAATFVLGNIDEVDTTLDGRAWPALGACSTA